jgi:lipopolysaccharide export system protein LptA
MTTTAQTIRLERQTGNALASGAVKTTYSELTPQPGGALLATSEPIHATANTMTANRDTGMAVYAGDARLWQGSNIVEGTTITFDQKQRSMVALGSPAKRVSTIFVQSRQAQGSQSKRNGTSPGDGTTPVNVSANRLSYLDQQRQVRFEGGVVAKSADGTLTADHVTVYLLPREQKGSSSMGLAPSQLDRMVADGHVVLQQPTRHGAGQHLVYTASDGKFVFTGGPPSIFDAERGTIRGDSLTFFSRDDRVLVETNTSSPTVTQTRVVK